MRISKLRPSFVIDADKHDEVIHFDAPRSISNGKVVYAKYRQLDVDFNGNLIENEEEYIRIKSLWRADLSTGSAEELVVYGQINAVRHEALCTEATNSGGWRVPHLAKARMACVGSEQTQGLKPIQQCTREGEPTSQDAGLASTTCYGQRKQSHV